MLKTIFVGVSIGFVLLAFAARSRSDASDPGELTTDTSFPLPDPAVGSASASAGAIAPGHLFESYDAGPAEAVWSYDQLTPAEKETADLGRDASGWEPSQVRRVEAVKGAVRRQAAVLAQRELGLGDLGATGVVP